MKIGKTLYVINRKDWRTWLKKNYNKESEIWLIYYKKHTGKPRIDYNDAVEEALCFGWIDSTGKRIDNEKYAQRFTPRKSNSVWSKINKEKAEKMIKLGKMTNVGLISIDEAKKNGMWRKAYTNKNIEKMPTDLKRALNREKQALDNFNNFANTYRNMYIGWIVEAKTNETRKKRISKVVENSKKNIKSFYLD